MRLNRHKSTTNGPCSIASYDRLLHTDGKVVIGPHIAASQILLRSGCRAQAAVAMAPGGRTDSTSNGGNDGGN